jgi:hypothetical protein
MSDYLQRLAMRGAGGVASSMPRPAAPAASPGLEEVSQELPVAGPMRSSSEPTPTLQPAVRSPVEPEGEPGDGPRLAAEPRTSTPQDISLATPAVREPASVQPQGGVTEVSAAEPPAEPLAPRRETLAPRRETAAVQPAPLVRPAPRQREPAPVAVAPPIQEVAVVVPSQAEPLVREVTLARPAPQTSSAGPPPSAAQARSEAPGPAIFIGRIDIEVGPPPSSAPGRPPIQRTRGFARYAKSRLGLRG